MSLCVSIVVFSLHCYRKGDVRINRIEMYELAADQEKHIIQAQIDCCESPCASHFHFFLTD